MQNPTEFELERAELDLVLSSDVFARSPKVAQILKYVCEAHFAGRSREIKEYNIAIEVFGRPADFDQARDSIVRVEAHRLRKRLQEFYTSQGAGHEIQIVLSPGNYVPQFVRRNGASSVSSPSLEGAAVVAQSGAPSSPPPPLQSPSPVRRFWQSRGFRLLWLYALSAMVILLVVCLVYARLPHQAAAAAPVPAKGRAAGAAAVSSSQGVRILAGAPGTKIVDHYGDTWDGDRYFNGGTVRAVPPRPIAYTRDPALFYHQRQGDFSYDIPLQNGSYELRLYFAETIFGENNAAGGGETSRAFRILANAKPLDDDPLDVIADAPGSNTADIKVFKDVKPAADGKLHLTFASIRNDVPFVNAIEIAPSEPGAIRPIRILAGKIGYTDENNRVWSSDRYFHNGVLVARTSPVAGADEKEVCHSERVGNFSYVIPVAKNGRYTVTMKFCESRHGPDAPGGAGDRIFDVLFNGRTLLGNFDIFKETGSLQALDKTFEGLEPNAQGKLIFTFTPTRNYAEINAIEVMDEAWRGPSGPHTQGSLHR
jgi:hypothetical protein